MEGGREKRAAYTELTREINPTKREGGGRGHGSICWYYLFLCSEFEKLLAGFCLGGESNKSKKERRKAGNKESFWVCLCVCAPARMCVNVLYW